MILKEVFSFTGNIIFLESQVEDYANTYRFVPFKIRTKASISTVTRTANITLEVPENIVR